MVAGVIGATTRAYLNILRYSTGKQEVTATAVAHVFANREGKRPLSAELHVREHLVLQVDDEDLLSPDDLGVFAVVHLVGDDDVQDHPAVVQEQAEHEEEPPDAETPGSRFGLKVALQVPEGSLDTPAAPVQLPDAERCVFFPARPRPARMDPAGLDVETGDERRVFYLVFVVVLVVICILVAVRPSFVG